MLVAIEKEGDSSAHRITRIRPPKTRGIVIPDKSFLSDEPPPIVNTSCAEDRVSKQRATPLCPAPKIVDKKTRIVNNEWAGSPWWKGRRRKYDRKFQFKAVKPLLESGKTVEEFAADLRMYYGNLSRLKRENRRDAGEAFSEMGNYSRRMKSCGG